MSVTVIGAGLAGSEAAWQLARLGVSVKLYEMRPNKLTPAHKSGDFGELVCSNSLGSDKPTSPAGILKAELAEFDSLIIDCARKCRVPAGGALAVDREGFAATITERLTALDSVEIIREEVATIPDGPVILATGPLMAGSLASELQGMLGEDYLHFFDAAAPIVTTESVDGERSFSAGRYGQDDDYINCPLIKEEYETFWQELVKAERAPLHDIDSREGEEAPSGKKARYFEGCLPVEIMGERGIDTLRFGPMRPVGLIDPRTEREPYAVVQLRRDNDSGTLHNLVGFQTNLRFGEQERVFRLIPALAEAEFVRWGVMHRNTFVCAPKVLDSAMRPAADGIPYRGDLFLAGQITGVEGYVESTASGLMAAFNACAVISGRPLPVWPAETAIGSLARYLMTAEVKSFQPMNVNLGIFPKLPQTGKRKKMSKPERSQAYGERAIEALRASALYADYGVKR